MKTIPFFRACVDKEEEELILEALYNFDSDMINRLEQNVKEYFNCDFAVSASNGTNAMHLALCAMETKRADKIICSVNSFPNVPEVIRHFDAEPIPVDINEDDFNIDVRSLEEALRKNKHKKLKAAFINHVAGTSSNMDRIYELAKEYNIKIIDDVGRSIGASYKNHKIGSMKDSFISCFQLNPSFQNSISNVGFFTTNDEEINNRAKILRNNGITTLNNNKSPLNYMYDVLEIGQKYDTSHVCAAFAKVQFSKVENFIKRRKEIAEIYFNELKDCPHITLPKKSDESIYTQFIIKVDKNRDNFARQMFDFGINTALHYIPIHLLTYYKQKYNFKVNEFPNALKSYQQILSIPIYADLKDDEVHYICDKIKLIAKNSV